MRDTRLYRRIVIKIGSSLLVEGHTPRVSWLRTVISDIHRLKYQNGAEILLVSSGAIALGRGILGLPPHMNLTLNTLQAAASVGQIVLGQVYRDVLKEKELIASQILLTPQDTEQARRHYLNARETLNTLLDMGVVPIVNENDTVTTQEIRYGDNDRLAARVAAMVAADCVILLSDVDGLYAAPPQEVPGAQFIETVPEITPEIEKMAGAAGSGLSRGGMRTKIEAARIATKSGVTLVITSGKRAHPLQPVFSDVFDVPPQRATWFPAKITPMKARKTWISSHLKAKGCVMIDRGAQEALSQGKSLLPVGAVSVSGRFFRGDLIEIVSLSGKVIGRGLSGYDASVAVQICGKNSREIVTLYADKARLTLIHRDDMVID